MAAGRYDFTLEQGATFSRSVAIKDSSGSAMDLTGCTARAKMRATATDSTVVASFTATISSPATAGLIDWSMSATTTAAISLTANTGPRKSPTKFAYDLEVEFLSGTVLRVLEGVVTVTPEVTR